MGGNSQDRLADRCRNENVPRFVRRDEGHGRHRQNEPKIRVHFAHVAHERSKIVDHFGDAEIHEAVAIRVEGPTAHSGCDRKDGSIQLGHEGFGQSECEHQNIGFGEQTTNRFEMFGSGAVDVVDAA